MGPLKGDIRIVHDSSAQLPKELPSFLSGRSKKAKDIFRIFRDVMGSNNFSELMTDFYKLSEIPMAILDLDANVLASSKWQRICTEFHRVNPMTCERCIESDTELANQLDEGAEYTMYKCKNGLVDCASPIIVDNEHIANIFIGQFLLNKPDIEFFKKQAKEFNFNEDDYISALNDVKIVDESKIPHIMSYMKKFAQIVTSMAYDKYLILENEKSQRKILESMINKRTKQLQIIDNFQMQFIAHTDPFDMYEHVRDELLELTDSAIGFIGEVQKKDDGKPFLKIFALSNIAWDKDTNDLYEKYKGIGFVFENLHNLFGHAILNKEVVLSNDPLNDPRASGFPVGHPILESFLGIPIYYGNKLVGEIGLANRDGGYNQDVIDLIKPLVKTCGQIIVARQEKEAREKAEKQLKELAQRDGLTGLYNRRYFNERIETEWKRCRREKQELSVIMVDIDYFKSYNDTYGHLKGDDCLKIIANVFKSCIKRPSDLVARYGGEEFIAVLPHTSINGAKNIAECFKDRLLDKALEHKSSKVSKYVTISMGIANITPSKESSIDQLLMLADDRLYEAKESGRDKIVFS